MKAIRITAAALHNTWTNGRLMSKDHFIHAVNALEAEGFEVEVDRNDYIYVSHPFGDIDERDLDDIVDIIEEENYRATAPRIVDGQAKILISHRQRSLPPGPRPYGVPNSYFW